MHAKKHLVFSVLCVCAMMFCVTGAAARYKTVADLKATASVAAFAFTADGAQAEDSQSIEISSNGEKNIGRVSVSNVENGTVSEVNQRYSIILNSDTPMPAAVTPQLECNGKTYYAVNVSSDRKVFEFTNSDFLMKAGTETTKDFNVKLIWITSTAPSTELNISVSAVGTQVD